MKQDKNLPWVTVIIASYNHAPYIEASISSVLAQEYPKLELLVVDDGSSDDSVAKIQRLADMNGFDFRAQTNQGLTRTLNAAIERATGSLIAPFGSDDIMLPGRIASQAAYLGAHPEAGICGGNVEFINADGELFPDAEQKQRDIAEQRIDFDDVFFSRKPIPPTATLMFRKDALVAVGGFNPDIALEDVYIWLKMTHAGYYIDRLPMLMARYRMHPTNSYRNQRFMAESLLATYAVYADHPAYAEVHSRLLNSLFLKAANRDRVLARELLGQLPLRYWNGKTVRGLLRYAWSVFSARSRT
jgi:alpha-1,3-rhamnosyltransferase